jgi:hypothetical protein
MNVGSGRVYSSVALLVVLLLTVAWATFSCSGSVTTTTSSAAPSGSSTTTTVLPATTTTLAGTATTAVPATTPEAGSTTTITAATATTVAGDPKGWKRFTSYGISVVLPDSFEGGSTDDSAAWDRVTEIAPDDMARMSEELANLDWLLVMFRDSPTFPRVVGLMVPSGAGQSLPDIGAGIRSYSTKGAKVETVERTATRESYLVTLGPSVGSTPWIELIVALDSNGVVYIVRYESPVSAWSELRPIYEQSAERIIVGSVSP